MKKSDLIELAEANDVELEDGMTVADITAALDLAGVEVVEDVPAAPAPTGIEVQLKRDVWDANGVRMRAPQIVTVPVEDAMDMVESGLASRVKK